MSDEESFVILGSSPMPSLNSLQSNNLQSDGQDVSVLSKDDGVDPKITSAASSATVEEFFSSAHNSSSIRVKDVQTINGEGVAAQIAEASQSVEVMEASQASSGGSVKTSNGLANGMANSDIKSQGSGVGSGTQGASLLSNSSGNTRDSLAASFILGEVHADVLKSSVYSQFPSLCSMEACAEDVVKLQNLMIEYGALKDVLSKVNNTMKRYYAETQDWKENQQRMETEYKKQLEECQIQIAALRNENLELKRDINEKVEQLKLCDAVRQKDQADLAQSISEKSAQISNMAATIEKLEQHQLASFEYIPKNENDSKIKPDYVDRLEHQRQIKELERKMSELLAENLELKDMQKQYIDEITCLKVNCTASEELLKVARADIAILKAEGGENCRRFTEYETERNKMRDELTLLRQQVDVYSKDFEMERLSRQNLAGEKDQLLQDLRSLQRKNQDLIEQTHKQWESFKNSPSYRASASIAAFEENSNQRPIRVLNAPSPSQPNASGGLPCCPVCYKTFPTGKLESHVNACLDKIST